MAEILATLLADILTMLDPLSGSKNHFAAYNIAAFLVMAQFKATMDQMLETLRTTEPASGHDRVLYPGLPVRIRRGTGAPGARYSTA